MASSLALCCMSRRGPTFILRGSDVQLTVAILFFITDSDFLMDTTSTMMEVEKGIIGAYGGTKIRQILKKKLSE